MSEAEQQTNETLKRIQTVQELYGCLSAALTMEEAREERAEALTPPSSRQSLLQLTQKLPIRGLAAFGVDRLAKEARNRIVVAAIPCRFDSEPQPTLDGAWGQLRAVRHQRV